MTENPTSYDCNMPDLILKTAGLYNSILGIINLFYTNLKLKNMNTSIVPEVLHNQLSTRQAQQNALTQIDLIAQE